MAKTLRWRFQTDDEGGFDELVVGRGPGMLIHAEMMDERSIFVDVAGLCVWAYVGKDGVARVTHTENRFVEPAQPRQKKRHRTTNPKGQR